MAVLVCGDFGTAAIYRRFSWLHRSSRDRNDAFSVTKRSDERSRETRNRLRQNLGLLPGHIEIEVVGLELNDSRLDLFPDGTRYVTIFRQPPGEMRIPLRMLAYFSTQAREYRLTVHGQVRAVKAVAPQFNELPTKRGPIDVVAGNANRINPTAMDVALGRLLRYEPIPVSGPCRATGRRSRPE